MSGFVIGPENMSDVVAAPFSDGSPAQNFTVINSDMLLPSGRKNDFVEVIAEATGLRIEFVRLDPNEGDEVNTFRWDVDFADFAEMATTAAKNVARSITAGRIPPFFNRRKG